MKDDHVDISGLDKAEVLLALFQASRQLGSGSVWIDRTDLTLEEARNVLKKSYFVDYLYGRHIKIDFTESHIYVAKYDKYAPEGVTVASVVEKLRSKNDDVSCLIL